MTKTTSQPSILSIIFFIIAIIWLVAGIFSFGSIVGAIYLIIASGSFVTAKLINTRH
jgi:hypothetical protein